MIVNVYPCAAGQTVVLKIPGTSRYSETHQASKEFQLFFRLNCWSHCTFSVCWCIVQSLTPKPNPCVLYLLLAVQREHKELLNCIKLSVVIPSVHIFTPNLTACIQYKASFLPLRTTAATLPHLLAAVSRSRGKLSDILSESCTERGGICCQKHQEGPTLINCLSCLHWSFGTCLNCLLPVLGTISDIKYCTCHWL